MMVKTKSIVINLIAAIASLFVSSACIVFVPFVYERHTAKLICSFGFWTFLIIGYVLIFFMKRRSRKIGFKSDKKRIGLFTFFKNPFAKAIDILLFIMLTLFVVLMLLKQGEGFIQYIILFVVLFLIHMHSLFNSDVYQYIQLEVRRGKE